MAENDPWTKLHELTLSLQRAFIHRNKERYIEVLEEIHAHLDGTPPLDLLDAIERAIDDARRGP